MAFDIEVLSIGENFDAEIKEAAQMLNGVQKEFFFHLPDTERLSTYGRSNFKQEHLDVDLFAFLQKYLATAGGGRRYVIGVIDQKLRSKNRINLFGSRLLNGNPENGIAVVTLRDWTGFTESSRQYLCYYMIRYALSFLDPKLRSHNKTRDCFFDFKERKADLQKSLASGRLCPEHRQEIAEAFTPEVNEAFGQITRAMKSLRADSKEELKAASLKGHIDVGIITMKPEEYKAVLHRFPRRRRVVGHRSDYSYTRVITKLPADDPKKRQEIRVVIARTASQAQGSAQALASSMLTDLNPRWLLVVGIAGGIPATEFSLGDVLLSQRCHDFSVSAVKQDKSPEYEDLGGPMATEVEKLVKDLPEWERDLGDWSDAKSLGQPRPKVVIPKIKAPKKKKKTVKLLYGPESWQEKVIKGLKANFPPEKKARRPICLPATFITSNTLVKSVDLAQSWLINARQSMAVEMELAGVMSAARAVGDNQTCVLAIRGISDVIGYERAPEWTEFACHSAAAFTHALLESGIIRPKK